MNLTGQWHFFEQFEAGFDIGYALLKQRGAHISGTLVYHEYIYDEPPFLIEVNIEGEVVEDRLMLRGQSYSVIESPYPIEYCLDDRIAELNNSSKVEGHSVDDQDLEGRFILRRMQTIGC
ncbi:hypothetical protein [Carboxylicivirga taeanensis]|uniref:hypothetical protein n=1 Tax=Carboxylicivirga taeanensis TaxID=1416875 RepID=UPI003F6E0E8D